MNASNATIQINCNHSSKTKDLPAGQSLLQLQLQLATVAKAATAAIVAPYLGNWMTKMERGNSSI